MYLRRKIFCLEYHEILVNDSQMSFADEAAQLENKSLCWNREVAVEIRKTHSKKRAVVKMMQLLFITKSGCTLPFGISLRSAFASDMTSVSKNDCTQTVDFLLLLGAEQYCK